MWLIPQKKSSTFWLDVYHHVIIAHLTSSFLGTLSCTSSYIITFELPWSLHLTLHHFLHSLWALSCYRICFSCSLTHYFQSKYKLIKLCGCLVQFILLNQSSNYLVIHHPKEISLMVKCVHEDVISRYVVSGPYSCLYWFCNIEQTICW